MFICFNKLSKVVISLFCLLISPLFLFGISSATDNPYEHHYPFNTVVIHYKVTGAEIGEEILYIKPDFKALFINTQYPYLDKMKPKKHLTLTTPEYIYYVDLIKKTGIKQNNLRKDLIKAFNSLPEKEKIVVKKNVEELGTALIGNLWGKRVPLYDNILGIDCDLIKIFGDRVLIWPGVNIPLKRTRTTKYGKYGNKIVSAALKIDKNVPIASAKFEIPEGILIMQDSYLPDRFETPEGILIKFHKVEYNEKLERKVMTQFHAMRVPNAIKIAKEKIARRILLYTVGIEENTPKDMEDSIFADQDVLNNPDIIYEIQHRDELEEDRNLKWREKKN